MGLFWRCWAFNEFGTPSQRPWVRFWGSKNVASSCPAHIWDLPRLWKSLLLMYKIFDMRTCRLSHQIKGPTTVKLAKTGFDCKIVKFTITGPLIWCDNPQVRMSKILYINNNDFHNLGRSQMCAGGCYVFRPSKPHSGTLWSVSSIKILWWKRTALERAFRRVMKFYCLK